MIILSLPARTLSLSLSSSAKRKTQTTPGQCQQSQRFPRTKAMEGGVEEDVEGEGEELSAESVRSAMEACDLDVVMALRTLEAVEKDAQSVASSLSSLLSSLQSALSQVTTSSVKHLECYNEVAGHVQEAALDAAMKGNRFINASLRLNEEMKGMTGLAAQLKVLRQTVDHFDRQAARLLPRS